ncbi:hypothetical protein ACH5RR_032192 [Cinchona calisaya]|uniref:Uncharacterized protein n=1 Tax=Cinchona calisaya TaxID=153742 RepID=A0ABD2YHE0_9GENT
MIRQREKWLTNSKCNNKNLNIVAKYIAMIADKESGKDDSHVEMIEVGQRTATMGTPTGNITAPLPASMDAANESTIMCILDKLEGVDVITPMQITQKHFRAYGIFN